MALVKFFLDSGQAAQSFREEGRAPTENCRTGFAAFAVWLNSTAKLSIAMRNRRERRKTVIKGASGVAASSYAVNLILRTPFPEKGCVRREKYFSGAPTA